MFKRDKIKEFSLVKIIDENILCNKEHTNFILTK